MLVGDLIDLRLKPQWQQLLLLQIHPREDLGALIFLTKAFMFKSGFSLKLGSPDQEVTSPVQHVTGPFQSIGPHQPTRSLVQSSTIQFSPVK